MNYNVFKNSKTNIFSQNHRVFFLKYLPLETIFSILVCLTVVYFLFHGYLYKIAFIFLFACCVYATSRFPLFTVFLLIILAVFPTVFQMIPEYSEEWMFIGFKIRIQDLLIVSMLGAVLLKVLFRVKELSARNNIGLFVSIILFGLWITFEIVRNINLYGLSAPGEFRYRYLILCIPLYVALFFSSAKRRKKLLKLLIVSSLIFPIMCIPVIGQLKGWRIGPDSRFFPSSISLGLLYGFLALSYGKKYNLVKIDRILFWFVFVSSGVIIIIDSHRSVWLAAVAAAATIYWFKEINRRNMMKNVSLLVISAIIIFFIAQQLIMISMKTNLVDFVVERTRHLIQIGEGYENTAAWRVAQWKMQMQKFYANPIAGQGFGGYWGLSGKLGVSPHSLYVQTLVKLGIVGMLFYLIIIVKIFAKFKRSIASYKMQADPEIAILIPGMVILIASQVFYAVYAFEYYSLLYIGLGVAASTEK